jgi:hypothetical protein
MNSFGPAVAALLQQERVMPLGPGNPVTSVKEQLASLTPESVVAPASLVDRDMASACLAGLWLYFDYLDESHRISQDIHTATGSYWHAILHRREPDFENAKYWFRRVGKHPVLSDLAIAVSDMEGSGSLPTMGLAWDPITFVDLCQLVQSGRSLLEPLCRQIQQREWSLLFEHCYAAARGND